MYGILVVMKSRSIAALKHRKPSTSFDLGPPYLTQFPGPTPAKTQYLEVLSLSFRVLPLLLSVFGDDLHHIANDCAFFTFLRRKSNTCRV